MRFVVSGLLFFFFSISLSAASSMPDSLYDNASGYASSSPNGQGAVASVHPLATKAGLDVLDAGGNAIDAAVAVALTLGVVDNHNSGIGGGNFAVIRYANGSIDALDGREMAPVKAHRDMYLRDGKGDTSLSSTGALAIGVPGSLAMFDYMLDKAGKKTLAELILPAADLAEAGFPLSQVSHDRLKRSVEKIKLFPATAKILLDDGGNPWPVGHQFQQKDLADTYRHIAKQGVEYFYRGDFARQLVKWMEQNGGIVSYEDFAGYQLKQRQPVISEYRGYQIYGFPPPSSGGVHVAQILNILENFDIATMPAEDRYHVMGQAMRLAFADRAHFLGDPDFVKVPKGLIDQSYADQLAKQVTLKTMAEDVTHGEPPKADTDFFGKHTTHLTVADKQGNWVAMTTTVNTSFGSKVIIPGTGVIMNNQMDDFSIQPGVPNMFGLVGNEANSVQSRKRPLSSMSPTLVLKDGKPVIGIGAAGGPTIISQVVQGLVNMIDLGLSTEQALKMPRVHQQWRPQITVVEASLPEPTKQLLTERGHKLRERNTFGSSTAIRVTEHGFDAVAEPRIVERNRQGAKAD